MKIFLRRQGHLVRHEKGGAEKEGKSKKESSHRRPESGSHYDWSSLSKDDFALFRERIKFPSSPP